jgi:Flp pilus assembly pilin Flp
MAEGIVAQAKEGVGDVTHTVTKKPVTALVVALIAVSLVVLIEIFFPGAITGRIRSMFNAVGVKGKAAS